MDRQPFLHDFQQRLLDLFRASPAADLERNLKALVNQSFNKLELVTREEFDIQIELMRELAARVEALEVAALRGGGAASTPAGQPGPAAADKRGPRSEADASHSAGRGASDDAGSESKHGGERSADFYPGVGGPPPPGRR